MPLGKGINYAVRQTSKGPIRLAFKNGKVVEAKNLKTKKTHTPAEFAADKKKSLAKKKK
jgi:leucyl aminopeptidase (aminopeptidase T)